MTWGVSFSTAVSNLPVTSVWRGAVVVVASARDTSEGSEAPTTVCCGYSSIPPAMSCYDLCRPCGPTPLANSCNEPCVRQCQDSRVVIEPSPVVVTLPGPILSSFPQNTAVGSTTSAAVGSILSAEGVPISSGGFGLSGISGLGGRYYGRRCLPC
ncbi:feather beta keratin-like isoform 1-T1 [Porphyrio hochstetteri]